MLLLAGERQHDFVTTFLSKVNCSCQNRPTNCTHDIAISVAFCSNAQTTIIRGNEDGFLHINVHTEPAWSPDQHKPTPNDPNIGSFCSFFSLGLFVSITSKTSLSLCQEIVLIIGSAKDRPLMF